MNRRNKLRKIVNGSIYKGTYQLTLDNFPGIKNQDGTWSNILTTYYEIEMDGKTKYILVPSLFKGKTIDDPYKHSKTTGKHFGIYDSIKKLNEADDFIHNKFKKNDTRYSK